MYPVVFGGQRLSWPGAMTATGSVFSESASVIRARSYWFVAGLYAGWGLIAATACLRPPATSRFGRPISTSIWYGALRTPLVNTQWAAVNTVRASISDPPQNCLS